jgi:phosphatidylinositol alpha 1,6-mannosyltransferase
VVAPAAGGPLDLVDHGVTGYLVAPGDAGALAGAVERLARDPQLRLAMGRAGREKTIGRSWRALGDQLIAHYAALLGEPWPALPLGVPVTAGVAGPQPGTGHEAGVPR